MGILIVWVMLLTFLYIKSVRHYKKLTAGDGKSLEDAINTIFSGLEKLNSKHTLLENKVTQIKQDSLKHIQKVAIKRFNPFGDTGGDQSFSVTMLDSNNDGVVFSSLHGRSGTRIYGKPVKSGKQDGYELSEEEQDIISLAIKGGKNGK